jgi:hypothetical protein
MDEGSDGGSPNTKLDNNEDEFERDENARSMFVDQQKITTGYSGEHSPTGRAAV